MTIQEKIIASHIPPATIAKHIGVLKGTFNNKLKGNNGTRFTVAEIEAIEKFFKDTCKNVSE